MNLGAITGFEAFPQGVNTTSPKSLNFLLFLLSDSFVKNICLVVEETKAHILVGLL